MASLFVLTGPSGAGKSTIAKAIFSQPELNIQKFITCTTRAPRPGEVHGKDYWFLTKEEFEQKLAHKGFFESAEVYGNYYGSSVEEMERVLAGIKPILVILDVQGAKTVKGLYPQTTLIFIDSPKSVLLHRLEERGTNAADLERRSAQIDTEEAFRTQADIVIENRDGQIEETTQKVIQTIQNPTAV